MKPRRGTAAARVAIALLAAAFGTAHAAAAADPTGPAAPSAPASSGPAPPTGAAPAARKSAPSPDAFRGPRDTWERLGRAVAHGDRKAALAELTPAARERYATELDQMVAARLDAAHFGRVQSVTLSGADFATLTVMRRKDDGTHSARVLLMRGPDGRWHVDQM